MGRYFDLGLLQRCLVAGRVPWFYTWKLAWPQHLLFAYPKWSINPRVWWQYLFPFAAAGVVVALWLGRRRLGRGPLTAMLAFLVVLSPALGLVSIYWHRYYFVADHVQYLACAALLALVIGAPSHCLHSARARIKWLRGAAMVVAGLAALTFFQTPMYRDSRTLWTTTLRRSPENWMANASLGMILLHERDFDAAATMFRKALRINPPAPGCPPGRPGAATMFRKALRINPQSYESENNLGMLLYQRGDVAAATACLYRAIAAFPRLAQAHSNLGQVLADQGDLVQAIHEFQIALRCGFREPQFNAAVHYQLGVALVKMGNPQDANREFREGLGLDPDDWRAHYGLGVTMAQMGHLADAASELLLAAGLEPRGSQMARDALARVRSELRKPGHDSLTPLPNSASPLSR